MSHSRISLEYKSLNMESAFHKQKLRLGIEITGLVRGCVAALPTNTEEDPKKELRQVTEEQSLCLLVLTFH